jgi:hypothetical protein
MVCGTRVNRNGFPTWGSDWIGCGHEGKLLERGSSVKYFVMQSRVLFPPVAPLQ